MWTGWPVERILYVFLAVVFAAIWVQVTLFHMRQNFRHISMWLPVVELPVATLLALAITLLRTPVLTLLFAIIMTLGVVGGLIGGYYHFAGVGERVDGYNLNNFMVGPPITLPLMVTAMSILGLITLYLV